jgi:phosphatidate cytidylyltransferase
VEVRLLVIVAAAFALGGAVIVSARWFPRGRTAIGDLWLLYRCEFLVVGAVLVPAALGPAFFAAALAVFAWRGQVELWRLFGTMPPAVVRFIAWAGVAGMVAVATAAGTALSVATLVALAAAALGGLAARAGLRATMLALSSIVFPGLFAALIAALRAAGDGFLWVCLVYATVEVNDAFALLTGKLLGRHALLPRLSPGKTAEGLAGGLLFGAGAGLTLARGLLGLSWPAAGKAVALILIGGLAGDLATSALKRSRGVKDFSPIHPALGGIIDVYDSFLVAAPLCYLVQLS